MCPSVFIFAAPLRPADDYWRQSSHTPRRASEPFLRPGGAAWRRTVDSHLACTSCTPGARSFSDTHCLRLWVRAAFQYQHSEFPTLILVTLNRKFSKSPMFTSASRNASLGIPTG